MTPPALTPSDTAPVERASHGESVGIRGAAGGVILLYHRVAEPPADPQLLAVSPAHFREHVHALTRECRMMSLPEMTERAGSGALPPRSVAITFDDGYEDNLVHAAPALREHGAPATVFVASGYVTEARPFWWDELERRLLRPGALPRMLSLSAGDATRSWDLGDAAAYGQLDFDQHRTWNVTQPHDPTPRHRAYRELFDWLRPMPPRDRDGALAALDAASCCDDHPRSPGVHAERKAESGAKDRPPSRVGNADPTYRPLTPEQLRELAADGLIEIGAHTVNHPVLSALPAAEQHAEIARCKADLEAIIDRPVTSFSYPFGTRRDYAPETVALVRQAGFGLACSNFAGLVTDAPDRFQLPRVLVRGWDADTLLARIGEISRVA